MNNTHWEVGVERETSPGSYITLSADISGWALWRFETAGGVFLIAGKAAEGCRRPEPLGVAQALYGGVPRMHVQIRERALAFISGTQLHHLKAEIRVEGDRFMQRLPVPLDPLPFDGKRLEVLLSTTPGPRSVSKIYRDHGFIDLTGLSAIVEAAREIQKISQ